MSKPPNPSQTTLFCGIDVSAITLAVAVEQPDRSFQQREFPNSAAGHKALLAWLDRSRTVVRASLEATGIYSLDLALALDRAPGIEVAVLNPKAFHRFAETLRRSKTDAADACALAVYTRQMDFLPWRAPNPVQLQLRTLSRHIDSLTEQRTRDKNRLHTARVSASTPACIVTDLKRSLVALQRRILRLRRGARALVQADDTLRRQFELLLATPGIAEISALQLLGELTLLSPEMSVRQWVAHSGLDPQHQSSGTSVHRPARISRFGNRHLRRVLYMPALSAMRHDPHLKAFYTALLDRHKTRMQALIAVARKLLHAIYAILKTGKPYDGAKLFPKLQLHTS
jgi:transposase